MDLTLLRNAHTSQHRDKIERNPQHQPDRHVVLVRERHHPEVFYTFGPDRGKLMDNHAHVWVNFWPVGQDGAQIGPRHNVAMAVFILIERGYTVELVQV